MTIDINLQYHKVVNGDYETLDEAKAALIKEDEVIQFNLLSESDWYVTRKAEKGIAIPYEIETYRDSCRTTGEARKVKINACSSVDELIELLTKPQVQFGDDGLVTIPNPGALDIWLLPDNSNRITS